MEAGMSDPTNPFQSRNELKDHFEMSDCPIVRGLKGTRVTVLMDGTTKIRPQLVEDTIGLIERLRAERAAVIIQLQAVIGYCPDTVDIGIADLAKQLAAEKKKRQQEYEETARQLNEAVCALAAEREAHKRTDETLRLRSQDYYVARDNVTKLREALEPFARLHVEPSMADDARAACCIIVTPETDKQTVTAGEIRRARAVLKETSDGRSSDA
jgi:hypothetical protein